MPHNKKHHYVPRFYLKRFSSKGRNISLWNITSQRKVLSANLKNQCYKDYFYGKDPQTEAALGDIESHSANIFRLIDQHLLPPNQWSEHHALLIPYILTQHGRTAYLADAVNEMNDQIVKHLYGPKAEAEGVDLSNITIGIQEAAQFSLAITTQCYPILMDLGCALLINETDVEFVTSDNPVVLYNQLFSFRRFGSNTGFSSKGLQIFFPISPDKTLLLYDLAVYSVGNKQSSAVKVNSTRDVFEINTLQMCSAYQNIYFQNADFNIEALHRKAAPFRRQRKSSLDVFPGRKTKHHSEEIIATSLEDVKTNLVLSFVRIKKGVKRWRDKFQKQKSQPAAVVRNQELLDDHREFLDKVDSKEYQPGDFYNFINHKYDKS